MPVSNKDIASLIIDFVQGAVQNNAVNEDYSESMDVVVSCISDAFEVDAGEASKVVAEKFGGKGLQALLEGGPSGAPEASSSASAPAEKSVPVNIAADEAENKAKAEALKAEGNKLMAQRDFAGAIDKYTEAVELVATNAVYYSNRAAAYSSSGKHNLAIKDASKAIELDPGYARAYSRLGLANYALGDAKAALQAYEKGLEIEGDKPSPGMTKGYETAKKRVQEEEAAVSSSARSASGEEGTGAGAGAGAGAGSGLPDLASLASQFGGGAGGMPDLGGLMNNPQVMQAAQRMMQDPNAMSNLMNNPMLRQMASSFGLGGAGSGSGSGAGAGADADADAGARSEGAQQEGGQPNLDELLNNPLLQNLANNFMGGNRGNSQ